MSLWTCRFDSCSGHKKHKMSGTAKLFGNPVLEKLTRTSASIAYTYYLGVVVFLVLINFWANSITPMNLLLTFLAGIAYWTLFEYVFHRFVFHLHGESERAKKISYTLHGVHHDFPLDKDRLIMPPVPWTILVLVFIGLYYLVLGQYALVFTAGKLMGYLLYIFVHWQVHVPNTPKFLKKQKIHHAIHHYQFDDKAFGVSSPVWDHIFGSMPPKESFALGLEKTEHGHS